MREIKFRAWDMISKRYFNLNDELSSIPFYEIFCHTPDSRALEIDQFTGLKDKNGVEIYENDIVEADSHNPPNYQIEFIEGGFCATWRAGDGFPIDINHFYGSAGIDIAVIGNIHQNPELLK